MSLGPTGEYPEGRHGSDDEGEINIGIAIDSFGDVRIDFGKSLEWMSMPPQRAIEFAMIIIAKAQKAQRGER